MKAVVFVNDQRMELIIQRLTEIGIEVSAGRVEQQMQSISDKAGQFDLVILPIQGVSDEGFIELKQKGYCMKEFFSKLAKEAWIFTGVITPYLKKLPQQVTSLLAKEAVINANAALTAEGLLSLIIMNTPRSIREYNYDIIGYGHCGKSIAELLHQLHLPVRIVSSHDRTKETQFPYEWILLKDWTFAQPYSVVINTAPTETVNEGMVNGWKKKPLIIDIASKAVGISEKVYKRKDIHIIAAPPLPGVVAYESAGEILADVIIQEVMK